MVELFANSGDPDQMPHSAASYLGLHCLPFTCLGVSSLQCVSIVFIYFLRESGWEQGPEVNFGITWSCLDDNPPIVFVYFTCQGKSLEIKKTKKTRQIAVSDFVL